MGTVKGYQLSDARTEFTGKRLLCAREIGRRTPDLSKELMSEQDILKSRIKFADDRRTAIAEVAPHFEANAGKQVDVASIRINEYGEIEREI